MSRRNKEHSSRGTHNGIDYSHLTRRQFLKLGLMAGGVGSLALGTGIGIGLLRKKIILSSTTDVNCFSDAANLEFEACHESGTFADLHISELKQMLNDSQMLPKNKQVFDNIFSVVEENQYRLEVNTFNDVITAGYGLTVKSFKGDGTLYLPKDFQNPVVRYTIIHELIHAANNFEKNPVSDDRLKQLRITSNHKSIMEYDIEEAYADYYEGVFALSMHDNGKMLSEGCNHYAIVKYLESKDLGIDKSNLYTYLHDRYFINFYGLNIFLCKSIIESCKKVINITTDPDKKQKYENDLKSYSEQLENSITTRKQIIDAWQNAKENGFEFNQQEKAALEEITKQGLIKDWFETREEWDLQMYEDSKKTSHINTGKLMGVVGIFFSWLESFDHKNQETHRFNQTEVDLLHRRNFLDQNALPVDFSI